MTKTQLALALLTFVASAPLAAQTRTVSDPTGDFNTPFYVGPLNNGLDVTSFTVSFDGTNFNLGATMAGPIDPTLVDGLLKPAYGALQWTKRSSGASGRWQTGTMCSSNVSNR